MADTQQLLLQAAEAALQEHQAGRLAPSVEDILHLEKRWNKLPGASTGSVALEDVTALLGAEVLAGEPLEFVVGQVFPGGGGTPGVLSKRQFLALAHVAEVAQSKAFDLVTAEDALRAHAPPTSGKKRPLAIRDAHIDRWQIAAATPPPALPDAHDDAPQYGATAAAAEPGPLERHLSRAESLPLPAGPLERGAQALSRQSSADDLAAAAQQAQRAQRAPALQSGATSYQSADDRGEEEAADTTRAAGGGTAEAPAAARHEASDRAGSAALHDDDARSSPSATQGGPRDEDSAVADASAGMQAAPPGKARSSWESFNSASASAGPAAEGPALTPPQQLLQAQASQPMSEAVIAAAMAAGMTFAQHLQAAGGSQASPYADVTPLRQAAVAAAAAMGHTAFSPPSPDVLPAGTPLQPQPHPQQLPPHVLAEMMSQLSMGGASPAQLQAAAATLQQQALALQQQAAQPAASRLGSVGSSVASGERAHSEAGAAQQAQRGGGARPSWKAFDGDAQLERRRAAAAPVAAELAPPRIAAPGIAGWEPMSAEDRRRCRAIFEKKGYPAVGGMERHCAMEYFSKLHMPAPVFHAAWAAADARADGRLDARAFCLFVQLLRGAQKGRAVPPRLSAEEAAALLGERPMPSGGGGGQPPLHIDAAHLRSVLQGQGHSRQASHASQEVAESVLHGFDRDDDDASSVDSGIAESVSGASLASYSHHAPATRALGPQHHHRTGLGSVLGGGAPAHHPALARPSASGAGAAAGAAHRLLEVAVRSAEVRYRKPLSTPIFSLSLRDSLGRLVELPIDTHPGHYRRETATIHSSAIVKLATQLHHVPPGSVLFLEIKHWKSDKKRFSTLAWAAAPLEKLVDFGPTAARVRSGPLDLPLFKKPLDASLRRTKRLTSRAFDLHLSVRGIE